MQIVENDGTALELIGKGKLLTPHKLLFNAKSPF